MKVATAQEMRSIDAQTIEMVGIPGIVLMENAGQAVTKIVKEILDDGKRVAIFVGRGNNGGDGLVVARYLALSGFNVTIYLLSEAERFRGDAKTNLQIAQNLQLKIKLLLSQEQLSAYRDEIQLCGVIVDSIFGTGLKGAVRGFAAELIAFINSTGKPIVAVDLPSGLDADTGRAESVCVHATHTVTIGLPKRGLMLYPGADFTGTLTVADIGFPQSIIDAQDIKVNWVQKDEANRLMPPRPRNSHKGTFGHLFVIAGSVGLTGAAVLASEAALRIGAGMVTLGIPKSLNPIMEEKLTEVMTIPLPETDSQSLALKAKSKIFDFLERTDVVAIGPGLSRNPQTIELIHQLSAEIKLPKVIDADGLNALSEKRELLNQLDSQTILTPHPGEMARLLDCSPGEVESDRIDVAQQFAGKYGLTLVLKGVPTVVASASGEIHINSTGNPGMATAGVGDVLTGVIAGLLAQGLKPVDAAVLGAYLHGLAGDIAAEKVGKSGLIAGDVLNMLPKTLDC
ncbi:TPA: NAD(P)H-hydrate dehydratase [Candidatus Poribacteria bacterium]|nr:NAD(P)H-hydrate dehydratase [Candidatus Poribacteria bacterium]